MKPRLVWSMLLALALAAGLMAWLTLGAQSAIANAPTPAINRYVAPPPLGNNSLNDCASISTPCATIGYAITQSASGNQINVASGWYTEHITMTNGVSIYGVGWDTVTGTVITGNFLAALPTVYIPPGVGASTVLSGVLVTGGGTNNPYDGGSGIAISYGSPTIVNAWVSNNTGYYGGGVSVNGGSPTFNNVSAWSNRALYGGGFYLTNNAVVTMTGDFAGTNGTVVANFATYDGGGIYMSGVTATLTGMRIYTNTAQNGGGGGVYIYQTPNQISLGLNGIGGNLANVGGGIYAYGSSNLLFWVNFIGDRLYGFGGNHSINSGGGVFLSQSSGLIQSNWFFDNRADSGSGGALELFYTSTVPTVQGNWFEGNTASSNGGALYINSGASPLINSNTIVTNTTCLGAGMYFYQSGVVTVTNNVIARNVSTCTGAYGGLQIDQQSPARIINNTIADNTGSGVWLNNSTGAVVVNNIIYGNTTNGIERYYSDPTTYTLDYNDVYLNSVNYSNVPPGTHDFSVNPSFVGSGPDLKAFYHLQATSPVSKTGSLSWAPAKDIDDEARVLCASMGADQLNCVTNRLYLPLIKK